MTEQTEMPKYRSHKVVHALEIAAIRFQQDGSAIIVPKEVGYGAFDTGPGWASRFKGTDDDLGVYVVYRDGYSSWSPTKEFRDGYSLITGSGE
tara:strand:+ start:63 stop:341 length:279 start_codon:yes stop_codon:yes gene_type:complete